MTFKQEVIKVMVMFMAAAALNPVLSVSWQDSWPEFAAEHWPQGEVNCYMGYRKFDPSLHKKTYYVGVHAQAGIEAAWRDFNLTFETYLNYAVGQRFRPPIEFKMKPSLDPLQDWVDLEEEVDFMYSDTGVFSCVGVEIGAQPLGTVISRLSARGTNYILDMYAGAMLTLADNEMQSVEDIKDKIIGAQSISDFAGSQVQFYVMAENGLNAIMDPKQVIFSENQEDIVRGVIDGLWDVGFVRTGQVERLTDENGKFLDMALFKVLEPRIFVMDDNTIFPFFHSTPPFPEWPFYAKKNNDKTVSEEVAVAISNLQYHKLVGERMHSCKQDICDPDNLGLDSSNCTRDMWEICETAPPVFFDPSARCDTTRELAELAFQAGMAGRHSGFRPPRSYFELRSMQEKAGFLRQDEKGKWQCSRAANLYEGIMCPEGYYKVNEKVFDRLCDEAGLPCPDGSMCYCRPCVKAFDVDIVQWNHSDDRTGVCEKMSMCGTVRQTESITFRAYDNVERAGAEVTAKLHVRQSSVELPVSRVSNESYVYEFNFSDTYLLGVGILEIFVNGEQIPESPFRVQVVPRDCDVDYPGQGKEPTEYGTCECGASYIEIGSECMPTAIFAAIIASVVAVFALQLLYIYLGYRRAKNDEMWQVQVEELHFSQPVEVIGQGSFGVVLLAEYRGTKVAIKRVLPMKDKRKGGSKAGSRSGGTVDENKSKEAVSADIETQNEEGEPPSKTKTKGPYKGEKGTYSFDPYMSSGNRSGGRGSSLFSGTDNELDDGLDFLGGISIGRRGSKYAKWFPWLSPDKESRYNASILGTASGTQGASSTALGYVCPWFDENARRQQEFIIEMRLLSRLRHPCITTVMGAVINRGHEPMMVMEYMENGSLYDLLRNETLYTGGEIIIQILRDVAQGLRFLHSSKPPILHGDLKAKNILVDSRFRAKVADFGLATKKNGGLSGTPFWMSPEYLRGKTEYNTCCDVYSFGIIMYEIYGRKSPYEGEHPRQTLRKICDPRINKRPPVPSCCPLKMVDIMTKAWSPDPFFRPQAKDLDLLFMDMNPNDAEPVLDDARRLRTEKATGDMLYDIFPRKVADKLKAGQKVESETHENVTVFFSDIVHFTDMSQTMTASKVCYMLDRLYVAFDALASKHKIFKVETIGDSWMGVANLENDQDETHVKAIAEFAIDAVKAAAEIMIDEENPQKGYVRIRAGFHSGPVVSNVIGSLNPRFGLFGDTVNTASRMESNSESQKVLCSEASAKLLKAQAPDIPLTRRGKINVKGKGSMVSYWVGKELLVAEHDGSISRTYDDHPTVRFVEPKEVLAETDE